MKKEPQVTEQHDAARIVVFPDGNKLNLDGPVGYNFYLRDLHNDPIYFGRRNFGGRSDMV
ncbi:hypothetical protein ANCDUO_01211 [Ancylostoma duodenale]|uniref:Uncharacterized protein n=1 Tax=Ancylostoma duodenale TaxID=51022 RepID=A0A0C2DZI6_9BILA|nr:hypothetical protein ANCDUO_01211 [Ancylostoma duodenale]